MRTRIVRILAAAALLATCGVLYAAPVLAFDGRAGDTVSVGPGEKVEGDLYLAGRSVSTAAGIDGDVFAAGQTVSIGGQIDGGLTAAGQTVLVSGGVSRGARVGGSTVDVTGTIGRDLLVGCSTFVLNPEASVGEDLLIGAATAMLKGDIAGNVYGGCEKLVIDCTIGGNVKVEVGTLEIRPGAVIQGNLEYTSAQQADVPAGAVKGSVRYTERAVKERVRPGDLGALGPLAAFAGLTWKLLAYAMALLTGIVLILVLPARMAGYSDAIRTETGPVAGWGAIAFFLTPLAALVVCITIVGLPLGLITLALWTVLLYLSQLPVALVIGHVILGYRKPLEGRGFMIGALALGLLIIALLRLIPFVGFFVGLATALFGFGSFVVAEKRHREKRGF